MRIVGSGKAPSGAATTFVPAEWASSDIQRFFSGVPASVSAQDQPQSTINKAASLEKRIFEALAAAKISTASVAMHLSTEWRQKLFRQLDSVHDIDEFDKDDSPVLPSSFRTFLRTTLLINPRRMPGLGLSSGGNMVAAWTKDSDRLTIEFFPGDRLIWTLSYVPENEGPPERAAGENSAERILEVLAPYMPDRWFNP